MIIQVQAGLLSRAARAGVRIAVMLAVCIAVGCSSPVERRIGETFDVGAFSYTVKDKEVKNRISFGDSSMEAGRGATFILVRYQVVNHGTDYAQVNPLLLRLETAGHTIYSVDLPATYALRMPSALKNGLSGGGPLPAGGSGSYIAAFRVPDDVARHKLNLVIRGRTVVAID